MTTPTRVRGEAARAAVRRSLVLFNWNQGFRMVFDGTASVTGMVFVAYAGALGIPKEKIGYLAAIVGLACVVQLVGLLVANGVRNRKLFTIALGALEVLFILLAVLGGYFAPPHLRFAVLAGTIFLAASSHHLMRPTLDEWFASSIPESIRSRYLSRRMMVISIVAVISSNLIGFAFDQIGKENRIGLALLLMGGTVFGFAAVAMFRGIVMPTISASAKLEWSSLREVITHAPFLRVLLGGFIYNIPFYLAVPYYQVYHLDVLGLQGKAIAGLTVGYYIIKTIAMPTLGKWVERLGPRLSIYLASPFYVAFFFCYAFSGPGRAWMVFLGWALIGMAEGCYGVAYTTALYGSIPESNARPAYFATYNLVLLLLGAGGAAAAARLVEGLKDSLGGHLYTLGPLHLGQYQILYGLCALILIPCILSTQLFPGRRKR